MRDISLNLVERRDLRTTNLPTASEIAVIIPDTISNSCRDIIIRKNSGQIQRISELHPSYDPMQYPLLFPRGEDGWNLSFHQRKTSLKQWGAFYLQIRFLILNRAENLNSNLLHLAGRLFHQYVVDLYAKIETNNLRFIRNNQSAIRAESYQGLSDALATDGARSLANIGTRIVLPATFIQSPRYFGQLYQDSMAMVRRYGKPDLFITMTCNPKWPEISRELLPNQLANDRPDIVARVFRAKLEALLDDLTKKNVRWVD